MIPERYPIQAPPLICGAWYSIRQYRQSMPREHKSHFISLGLLPKSRFQFKRFGPFQKTLQIDTEHGTLALRLEEIEYLDFEALPPHATDH